MKCWTPESRPKVYPHGPRRVGRLATLHGLLAVVLAAPTGVAAAPSPDVQPATAPAAAAAAAAPAHPALDQLNRECVALYEGLRGSVLRVQMPTPLWAANAAQQPQAGNRFDRYTKLNPDVRKRLAGQQSTPRGGNGTNGVGQSNPAGNSTLNGAAAATQPSAAGGNGTNDGANGSPAAGNERSPLQQQQQQQQQSQPQQQQLQQEAKQYTLIVPPVQNAAAADPGGQPLQVGNRANGGGGGRGNAAGPQADGFAANQVGLLLNDDGDVLVPTYVEREAVGEGPVRLAVGDAAEPIDARFVGSDEQTQLTVLRLVRPAGKGQAAGTGQGAVKGQVAAKAEAGAKGEAETAADGQAKAKADVAKADSAKAVGAKAVAANTANADDGPTAVAGLAALGKPVRLSPDRLADGTLVLVVSPVDGAGRLAVWNNNGAREFGVVVTIDGRVAGIARGGQFLSGRACQLIADQIVRHGAVRRATLGVIITQVDAADPTRQQLAELGDRPAVRVDQVIRGSAADRGGVRAGDLILAVAGEPVQDIPSLAAAIAGREGPADLRLLRDGAPVSATVELVPR